MLWYMESKRERGSMKQTIKNAAFWRGFSEREVGGERK